MRLETRHRPGQNRHPFAGEPTGRATGRARRLPAYRQATLQRALRAPQRAQTGGVALGVAPAPAIALEAIATLPRPSIHNALQLPRFSKEIPSAFDLPSNADGPRALAAIAQALLDEGILREEDYQHAGNLADAVHCGLNRWAITECGAERIKHFGLALIYADHAEELGPALRWWPHGEWRWGQDSFGLLGLTGDAYRDGLSYVHVGATIMKIEALQKGAGFAVLGLIEDALPDLLCCATPHWSLGAAKFYDLFNGGGYRSDYPDEAGDIEDNESGLLTEKEFFAAIPRAACDVEWTPAKSRLLRRAQKRAGSEPGGKLAAIIGCAREFEALLQKARHDMTSWDGIPTDYYTRATAINQLCWLSQCTDMPEALIRWSKEDPIPRIVDDHHQFVWECGSQCPISDEDGEPEELLFARVFRLDVEVPETTIGSLRHAVRGLKYAVQLLVKLNDLLNLLDSDEMPPAHKDCKPRRKKSSKLIDILAASTPSENDGREFVTQL